MKMTIPENKTQLPLVSIITINFNQADLTEQLLKSLMKINYNNIEIIVVDNGSENPPDILKSRFTKIKLIKTGKNLGFAGGNNYGILHSSGNYLLFLNNDTEVEPDFLNPLVNVFDKYPNVGMVSPRIVYWNNGKKNIVQYAGSKGLNPFTGRGFNIGHGENNSNNFNYVKETELCHGAAMMVSSKIIRNVGLMPDLYFLYYEEHDWCELIKRKGFRVFYVGTSIIYHKESMTVGKESKLRTYYLNRGRLIFSRRNTSGYRKISAIIFYSLFSLPKNSIKLLLEKKLKLLFVLWQSYFWNCTHFDVSKNPLLRIDDDGTKRIVNQSFNMKKNLH